KKHYMHNTVEVFSLFTDFDVSLFKAGKHFKLYEKFGAHHLEKEERKGTYFAVWAPNARSVSVIGDFNGWNPHLPDLYIRWDASGIWEGFIPDVPLGANYKYLIKTTTGEN